MTNTDAAARVAADEPALDHPGGRRDPRRAVETHDDSGRSAAIINVLADAFPSAVIDPDLT